MEVPEELEIYYIGPNGAKFHWVGENAKAEGIGLGYGALGTSFEDMFEAPFEAIYESTAFELGGHYHGLKEGMFEFTLAFTVESIGAVSNIPWRVLNSRFRKALSPKKDGEIHVIVKGESHRWLKVRLRGQPKLKVEVDPNRKKFGLVLVTFVAAYPRWLSEDWVREVVAETDTTAGGMEIQYIKASNPTNTEVWPKYVVQAGNAGITVTLPDFSFGDDRFDRPTEDEDRMVELPALILNEHVVVDTDEMTIAGQVVSSLDTQVYQRMNGREFLYPFQPYMDPIDLPVVFENALPGNKVQIRIPRPWTAAWGLE